MDVNKSINFTIDIIDGKEKKYYAICVNIFDVKRVIAWLNENQYNTLISKLS